jgi:TnpA family transposase
MPINGIYNAVHVIRGETLSARRSRYRCDESAYTEINFAAFAMLGLRFCPRIRGVQHQRIYRIDPNCDYGSLASPVSRADQTIDTEQIAEHWDRMGQLHASLKTGHVSASVALKPVGLTPASCGSR